MSIKSKVFAAAATLALVGGVALPWRDLRERRHPVVWPGLRRLVQP